MHILPVKPVGPHYSTILSNTTAFSPGDRPTGTDVLIVQAITQNIRFTLSPDSAPTATTGFRILAANECSLIEMSGNTVPKFIAESSGAVLQYQWAKTKTGS